MTKTDLYRGYIACLNNQDWQRLHRFVHDDVHYNGDRVGLSGYREMLERDFREIPDLYFDVQLLISEPLSSPAAFSSTARPRERSSAFPSTAGRSPSARTSSMNF